MRGTVKIVVGAVLLVCFAASLCSAGVTKINRRCITKADYLKAAVRAETPAESPTPALQAPILVVDDDGSNGGTYAEVRAFFTDALDSAGYAGQYDLLEVPYNSNGPDSAYMADYQVVIWFTGETWNSTYCVTLSGVDEVELGKYLNAGGGLFLCAQDYFWDRYPTAGAFSPGQFPYDYLQVTHTYQDAWGDLTSCTAGGQAGSLAEGLNYNCQNPFPGGSMLYADTLGTSATTVFNITTPSPNAPVALQYDSGTYKLVFTTLAFPGFQDGAPPNTKGELMHRIIQWLLPVGVSEATSRRYTPSSYGLSQNRPNPVQGTTSISYCLPEKAQIGLRLYDVTGRPVKVLISGIGQPGYHVVDWDRTDNLGRPVADGVYFYRLTANDFSQTRKLVVVR